MSDRCFRGRARVLLALVALVAGPALFVCKHILGAPSFLASVTSAVAYVASSRNGSIPVVGGTGAKCVSARFVKGTKGVSARVVNAGLGTTATRSVKDWFCRNKVPSSHWQDCCRCKPKDRTLQHELISLYNHSFFECVNRKAKTKDCQTRVLLRDIRKKLSKILSSGIRSFGDVPYPELLPQIMQEAPDTRVLFTQRDPEEWAQKRMANHPPSIMCKSRAGWKGSCFDIMNCCQPSQHKFVSECWTLTYHWKVKEEDGPVRNETLRRMATCMKEHNRLVQDLVPEHQLLRLNAFEGGNLTAELDCAIQP